jgi:hypothetical protein
VVDVGTGVKVGEEVVRWAVRRGIVKKTVDRFRPKHHVLVVGTSGAGKTNFLTSLTEQSTRAVGRDDRTRFSVAKTLVMPGRSKPFVFHDTPGPFSRRFYTWSCDTQCRTCLTEREMLAGHASIYHRSNLQYQSTILYLQHPTLRWSWNAFDEVDRTP